MKIPKYLLAMFSAVLMVSSLLAGQQQTVASSVVVPRLVNFSGKAADAQGKILSGAVGIIFAIYKDQNEGAPLWIETQNVTADAKGNFTAQLGATSSAGLPLDLFTTGEARWLGVRVNGGEELPRVLLLSVPYALKAADAETLGGLPRSAFVLAAPATVAAASASSATVSAGITPPVNPAVTGVGTFARFRCGTPPATSPAPQSPRLAVAAPLALASIRLRLRRSM